MLAVPPASSLIRGAAAGIGLRRVDPVEEVRRAFPGTHSVAAYESGRAALAAAMSVAMRRTGRRTVLLPAYTSYSVAAAAAVAGARVRLYDVGPDTLDAEPASLEACLGRDVAAIVLGNLFGWPSRLPVAARAAGTLIIDDAAQALGAEEGGAAVGSRGDLGVLSFGRGKCVTLGDGGVLLVHRPELADAASAVHPSGRAGSLRPWLLALAVALARQPVLFGLATRVGIGAVGASRYVPAFGMRSMAHSAAGMAKGLAGRIARESGARMVVAGNWRRALADARLAIPATPSGATPAYLRFPVLAPTAAARASLTAGLASVGLAYVGAYPSPLGGIAQFRASCVLDGPPTPGAMELSARVIALPCHEGVDENTIRSAADVLRRWDELQ